jgi:hypothetical protein
MLFNAQNFIVQEEIKDSLCLFRTNYIILQLGTFSRLFCDQIACRIAWFVNKNIFLEIDMLLKYAQDNILNVHLHQNLYDIIKILCCIPSLTVGGMPYLKKKFDSSKFTSC